MKALTLRAYDAASWEHLYDTVCEAKDAPLWWQEKGLQFTASGYGKKIPTSQMVKFNGKWRRVYCCIFSNSGTCYIGNFFAKSGTIFTVSE